MNALTKDDIKNIKKCDTIIVEYFNDKSSIRLIRDESTTKDGGKVSYPDVEIPVTCSFTNYQTPAESDGYASPNSDKPRSCHAHVSTHYGIGQFLVDYLRADDGVFVEWESNTANGYMWNVTSNHPDYKGQRIYVDACKLTIKRGNKQYELIVANSHAPANSARMVKFN